MLISKLMIHRTAGTECVDFSFGRVAPDRPPLRPLAQITHFGRGKLFGFLLESKDLLSKDVSFPVLCVVQSFGAIWSVRLRHFHFSLICPLPGYGSLGVWTSPNRAMQRYMEDVLCCFTSKSFTCREGKRELYLLLGFPPRSPAQETHFGWGKVFGFGV